MIAAVESSRDPALDGLRAVAIILVLLYHLTPGRDSNQGFDSIVFKLADIGWSGVDLFFVLSGFLVTRILIRDQDKGRSLGIFFKRRLLRIVPACFVALAIAFILFPILSGLYAVIPASAQLPYWFYVSNYFPSQIPAEALQVGHFWSLAVEMQFYLLWPFVVRSITRKKLVVVILYLLSMACIWRLLLVSAGAAWSVTYEWLPSRIDGLIVGALVAVWFESNRKFHGLLPKVIVVTALLLGAVIASVAWFDYAGAVFKSDSTTINEWLRVLLPTALALFYGSLLFLALRSAFLSRILGNRLCSTIAKYSYGIYIVHFMLIPVFERNILEEISASPVLHGDSSIYLYFLICSFVSFGIAYLSYHLVEKHFLRIGHRDR